MRGRAAGRDRAGRGRGRRAIPSERILGREVDCDNFQDAAAFLRDGGERGRQLAFLTAGTYRINPALFEVITARQRRGSTACTPRELQVRRGRARQGGHRHHARRRARSPRATWPARRSSGHDSFQTRAGVHRRRRLPRPAGAGAARRARGTSTRGSCRSSRSPMTEIPIGYVGVVVSYVGQRAPRRLGRRLHARRPGRARPQGRLGRAAAARQAPAQHPGDEGRAGADHQHRPQLGGAHRGAPLRREALADHGALARTASPSRSTCRRSSTSA